MKASKIKKIFSLVLFSGILFVSYGKEKASVSQYKPPIDATTDLHAFFKFTGDGSIIVSGHRGGLETGYPENSLEGLQNVLKQMPAFFEIDPRLTKDSVIVLMHDAELDRTSNGAGKLSNYTWTELQSLRLKDKDGKITNCKIPTLEEVILWSKGKTVVNLDKKDVPMEMIVEIIKKCRAENNIMLTVHTGAQARYYYDRFPNIMLSVFARDNKEYEDIAISGVPWRNMIAYVGYSINEKNIHIVKKLHENGVRCMISVSPTHDRLKSAAERAEAYKKEIALKPDIIESDLPLEIFQAISHLRSNFSQPAQQAPHKQR
ncbi:MAG: glycerophosphodiester phosphodiesterase family protein [Dysgonamonadaceae bacterium]|nr:glycerophosphodiester phosphodiesterase family protein [Dysgonamonadaceae bacterium]